MHIRIHIRIEKSPSPHGPRSSLPPATEPGEIHATQIGQRVGKGGGIVRVLSSLNRRAVERFALRMITGLKLQTCFESITMRDFGTGRFFLVQVCSRSEGMGIRGLFTPGIQRVMGLKGEGPGFGVCSPIALRTFYGLAGDVGHGGGD